MSLALNHIVSVWRPIQRPRILAQGRDSFRDQDGMQINFDDLWPNQSPLMKIIHQFFFFFDYLISWKEDSTHNPYKILTLNLLDSKKLKKEQTKTIQTWYFREQDIWRMSRPAETAQQLSIATLYESLTNHCKSSNKACFKSRHGFRLTNTQTNKQTCWRGSAYPSFPEQFHA
jgi:hypothetical protein